MPGFNRHGQGFSMKKSLRIQSVLVMLLHILLFLMLLWTASVPLEQIQQITSENTDSIGNGGVFRENLVQVETLIWCATIFTAVSGLVFQWMILRRVLHPVISIQDSIHKISRGDPGTRIQIPSGKEFAALATAINGLMDRQKEMHERLESLNRTLSAVSACRHEIIHEIDETQLNQKICQILVDIGAYRTARVGYAENGAHGTVTLAAVARNQPKCQNEIQHTVPESRAESACSPEVRAIRNRHPAIIDDVFGDPLFAPLQADATRHGYASMISLPLSAKERILGALSLYAEKPGTFGTEEVRLLTELADDLAHGIHAIRYTGR
jgi:HAMP domain-containing protein